MFTWRNTFLPKCLFSSVSIFVLFYFFKKALEISGFVMGQDSQKLYFASLVCLRSNDSIKCCIALTASMAADLRF